MNPTLSRAIALALATLPLVAPLSSEAATYEARVRLQGLSPAATPVAGPSVSTSTKSLPFGNVNVGATSDPLSVLISNVGSAPFTFSSAVSVSGAEFSATSNCGSTLAAGASCSASVRFAPSDSGSFSGSLTISGDSANSPLVVSLSGTGIGTSTADLDTTSLSFSSTKVNATSTQTVRLTNNGTASLGILSAAALSGSPLFSKSTDSCGASLPAGAHCDVTVQFAPTSTTPASGTLTFDTSAGTKTVSLSGAGQLLANTVGALSLPAATTTTGSFTLTAPTSSSAGAWSYSSSNTSVATVSGSTVTIVGAGTTTITATQAATSTYEGASTSSTLTVTQAFPAGYLSAGGLTWAPAGTTPMTLAQASTYCSNLVVNGTTGWRLPVKSETDALRNTHSAETLRNSGWPAATWSWIWVNSYYNGSNMWVYAVDLSSVNHASNPDSTKLNYSYTPPGATSFVGCVRAQ